MGFGINVPDLDYADDISALAADPTTVQAMLNEIAYSLSMKSLKINWVWVSKTMSMKISKVKSKIIYLSVQSEHQFILYGQELEKFDGFTILIH